MGRDLRESVVGADGILLGMELKEMRRDWAMKVGTQGTWC